MGLPAILSFLRVLSWMLFGSGGVSLAAAPATFAVGVERCDPRA